MKQRLPPVIAAVLCLAFAAFIAWIFATVTFITCNRVEPAQVDCVIQDKFLGVVPLGKPKTLHNVRSATMMTDYDVFDDAPGAVFLLLHTRDDVLKLEFNRYVSADQAEQQLTAFLQSEDDAIQVRDTQGWFGSLCGGFLFLDILFFGGMFLLVAFEKRKT